METSRPVGTQQIFLKFKNSKDYGERRNLNSVERCIKEPEMKILNKTPETLKPRVPSSIPYLKRGSDVVLPVAEGALK
ncbi:hypothetical protein SNE40_022173 [Patella caerulea]|uniref:Uncharacterized protein n=1 Tax=Patella caerulea TaxID=87958 RepID=A0AAN8G3C3_PATCE